MLNLGVKDAVSHGAYAVPPMETMGDRIRRLRIARGYTQQGLAEMCGVTKSAVSQWEGGSTANIKLKSFLKLIDALHTDADYLIWGEARSPDGDPGSSGRYRRPPHTSSR